MYFKMTEAYTTKQDLGFIKARLLLQAKDVAENTFLMALDSMNLSPYRSSLRYGLSPIFFFSPLCETFSQA